MSEFVKTIKLRKPVKRGDSEIITEIKFKELTGKMIKKLSVSSKQTIEDWIPVAVAASGVNSDVFDKMGATDLMEVVGYLGESLDDGQPTGEKSSD